MAKLKDPIKRVVAKMIADYLCDVANGNDGLSGNFDLIATARALGLHPKDVQLLKKEIDLERQRQSVRASLPRKWIAARAELEK